MISPEQRTQVQVRAQREFERVWPAEISLPGLTSGLVSCAGGGVSETGGTLVPGGLLLDFSLAFRVRKELLSGVPDQRKALTYLGKSWAIVRVVNSPHDVAYFIGADNLSK